MSALMPIGIIEESNEDGGIMVLTRPGDGAELRHDTPVVIWNQVGESCARMRGLITEISGQTASFRITGSEIDPGWPERMDPRGRGNPVYLGAPYGYLPLTNRWASSGEMEMLDEFARRHEEETGIGPTTGYIVGATPNRAELRREYETDGPWE